MSVAVETCENCGGTIGKLETPMVWSGNVVCSTCHAKLSAPAAPVADYARPGLDAQTHRQLSRPAPVAIEKVVTVQQTGKIWKVQQLLAALMSIVGICMLMIGGANANGSGGAVAGLGILLLIGGLLWFAFARIGAWWCHG